MADLGAEGYYAEVVARLLASGDVAAAVSAFVAPAREAGPEAMPALLWEAWDNVVFAAGHADDTGRRLLVELVAAVKSEDPLFADLPILGAAMREWWNWTPNDPRAQSVEWWTGLNAFAAQLTPDTLDLLLFGLWTLRDALETADDAAAHLPAAVRWFQYGGEALASAAVRGLDYGRPGRLGELAERAGLTEGGFTVARWAFWRSRMENLSPEGLAFLRRFDHQLDRPA